jgi:hypothetical protein
MAVAAQVKGVWFVTAKRHLVETHGASKLHAIARAMKREHGAILLEPLASEWYSEDVFHDAMRAVHHVHAQLDTRVFCEFIEACTVLGVHSFFRILLRITSPAYLLQKMPVITAQYRRNDWTCVVEADEERATITYRNCPYVADRIYRLYATAMIAKVVELCSGQRPAIEVADHGPDWMTMAVQYVA